MTSTIDLNHLRRGARYTAVTARGIARGEYLGIEIAFGDWSILLRHSRGTTSIAIDDLNSVTPV